MQQDNNKKKNKRVNRKKRRQRKRGGSSILDILGGGISLILMIPRSFVMKVALVIVLIAFITSVYSSKNAKDVPLADINKELISQTKIEKMEQCNARQLMQNIGINASDYDSFLYYKSKNNMNADEVLILKADPSGSLNAAEDAVADYAAAREKTFGQYAPKEAAKQRNAIIQQRGRYLFYCAVSKPEQYEEVFNHAV